MGTQSQAAQSHRSNEKGQDLKPGPSGSATVGELDLSMMGAPDGRIFHSSTAYWTPGTGPALF